MVKKINTKKIFAEAAAGILILTALQSVAATAEVQQPAREQTKHRQLNVEIIYLPYTDRNQNQKTSLEHIEQTAQEVFTAFETKTQGKITYNLKTIQQAPAVPAADIKCDASTLQNNYKKLFQYKNTIKIYVTDRVARYGKDQSKHNCQYSGLALPEKNAIHINGMTYPDMTIAPENKLEQLVFAHELLHLHNMPHVIEAPYKNKINPERISMKGQKFFEYSDAIDVMGSKPRGKTQNDLNYGLWSIAPFSMYKLGLYTIENKSVVVVKNKPSHKIRIYANAQEPGKTQLVLLKTKKEYGIQNVIEYSPPGEPNPTQGKSGYEKWQGLRVLTIFKMNDINLYSVLWTNQNYQKTRILQTQKQIFKIKILKKTPQWVDVSIKHKSV